MGLAGCAREPVTSRSATVAAFAAFGMGAVIAWRAVSIASRTPGEGMAADALSVAGTSADWRPAGGLAGDGRGRGFVGDRPAPRRSAAIVSTGSPRLPRRHRASRTRSPPCGAMPSTIANTLTPTISERACLRRRLASLLVLEPRGGWSAGRAPSRAGASPRRRLGGAPRGGDEVRLAAGVGNDRRLGRTERRLGGGDAIRRRTGVAPAGHARARLERMVGRQVRIDRPAFRRGRRSGLGRRSALPVLGSGRSLRSGRGSSSAIGVATAEPRAAAGWSAAAGSSTGATGAAALADVAGRRRLCRGGRVPAWSCRACRFRSWRAGRRRARAYRARPRANPGSSCPSA